MGTPPAACLRSPVAGRPPAGGKGTRRRRLCQAINAQKASWEDEPSGQKPFRGGGGIVVFTILVAIATGRSRPPAAAGKVGVTSGRKEPRPISIPSWTDIHRFSLTLLLIAAAILA
ncbi:MAG: hypothetical protein CMF63_02215 [Magnetovibrio sp.]|nr:hypothetical protein [Magnetovibrio sp.]